MITKNCECEAYDFPHRLGSGKCFQKCMYCKKTDKVILRESIDYEPYGDRTIERISTYNFCERCNKWLP